MKPHLLIPAILTLFSSLVHADTTATNEAGRQWPDNRAEIRQSAAPDAVPSGLREVSPLQGSLGGAVLLLLGGLLVWNRRLLRESRERKHLEQQLRDTEEALTETRRLAHIGWWQWDLESNRISWSDELYSIIGLSPETFTPTPDNFMTVVHEDDRAALRVKLDEVLEGKSDHYLTEFRIVRPDGEIRFINAFGKLYQGTKQPGRHFGGVLHDITEQKRAELALREKQHTLQTLLDNAPIGIWLQNAEGRLLFVNHAYCSSIGISEERFLSVPHYAELYEKETAGRCMLTDAEAMASTTPCTSYETVRFVDGRMHDLEIIKARLTDENGAVSGLIGLSMDITEKKQAEARLRHQAYFDDLTGLPNRTYLMEQLGKSLAQARRHDYFNALLFFDLDNFKIINDTLGHHTGDILLKEIGERLRQIVRTEDTPARLGGDEFVVIVSELGSDLDMAVSHSHQIAEKMRESLSRPFLLGEHEHHLTVSIGISMYPMETGEDANDILKHADAAMYRAKETGRNTISFFLPSMQKAAEERLKLQNLLRHAISQEQMHLVFQPQYDRHGIIRGAETLLRWDHPQLGSVSPTRFIPVAEESGQILDIGIWVLREACRRLRQWQSKGLPIETLSINVSPRQFHQDNFVEQVRTIVSKTGADPALLEFELTEGILIENAENVSRKMRELKALGFRFAIDDFGTGYSSLAYLKRLPLDRLKIDQSFVRDVLTDTSDALIVETIIAMASHLKLEVIAEGVENEQELDFLREKGCYHYQGNYLSLPLGTAEFEALLCVPHQGAGDSLEPEGETLR
jgi:diguanylate cyclase (GGDEF)-like protein/PAS domain S-box-containing protein